MARKKAYRYPLYLIAKSATGALALLPRPVLLALAGAGGRLAYYLVARQRSRALENLRFAFGGEKSEKEIRSLAQRVFVNVTQTAAELLNFPRLSWAQIDRIVDFGNAEGIYREILGEGRGLISLTAHIGNWELLAGAMVSRGFTGCVIGRRIYYEPYNRWIIGLRESVGVPTVYRDSSPKELFRILRENKIVGILPDQDIDSLNGIFADFFGRPAYTPVAPAKLSLATGAPILPNFLIRQKGGRYRIVAGEVIRPDRDEPKEAAVQRMTQAWMASCEKVIRQFPDQWAWMHNRWKTRPEANLKFAPGSTRA